MDFETKKKEYKKILVDEYRMSHPKETEGLTDAEVELMNPITDADFDMFLFNELSALTAEITSLIEEHDNIEKLIKGKKICYVDIAEYRSELSQLIIQISKLRKQYDVLNKIYTERVNKNERNR